MTEKPHVTEREIEEIRIRLGSATPGPWRSFVEGRDHQSGSNFIQTSGEDIELTGATTSDQDFIANARQDVEKLLKEVERLQTLLGV